MPAALPPPFVCQVQAVRVLDGDTFDCGAVRVRLARLDTPELPGHCRRGRHCAPGDGYASRTALVRFIGDRPLLCTPVSASPRGGSAWDRYGRLVASCTVAGVDVTRWMIRQGWGVEWPHG